MGTAERRERQRLELRGRILEAARELFTEHGYEAVTMRKVAEKIEYSPTTIYLHFADKDELVRELCTQDFLALAAHFRELARERDPVRRLRSIGRGMVRFASERPNHYRMMFMTPHPPVAVGKRRIEKDNPEVDAWALLKGTVAEAQQAGLLAGHPGGPEAVAQVLFAAIHGVAALHIAKANDPWIDWLPLDEMVERTLDVLLRGCGVDAPGARRRREGGGQQRDRRRAHTARPRTPGRR